MEYFIHNASISVVIFVIRSLTVATYQKQINTEVILSIGIL